MLEQLRTALILARVYGDLRSSGAGSIKILCSSRDSILLRFMGVGSGKSVPIGELETIAVAMFGRPLNWVVLGEMQYLKCIHGCRTCVHEVWVHVG